MQRKESNFLLWPELMELKLIFLFDQVDYHKRLLLDEKIKYLHPGRGTLFFHAIADCLRFKDEGSFRNAAV